FNEAQPVYTLERGEAWIPRNAFIDRLQTALETVLHLQKQAVSGKVGEGLIPHDRLIQSVVRSTGGLLDPLRAAECDRHFQSIKIHRSPHAGGVINKKQVSGPSVPPDH